MESTVRELTAELQDVKEEKQNLLERVSQEQANIISVNEKLRAAEKLQQETEAKNESLSKELAVLRETCREEANSLRTDISEKDKLMKDIREESAKLRESEVERAINQEREKANARLDGILNELTKSNQGISTSTADLEGKKIRFIEAARRQY